MTPILEKIRHKEMELARMSNVVSTEIHQGYLVVKYRKAKKWSQQRLADEIKVSLRTMQRIEQEATIQSIERRRLLVALLGIPAVLMGLENETTHLPQKSSLIFNDDPMSFFEEQLQGRWEILLIGGPLKASYGLDRWVREANHFTTIVKGSEWKYRALSLLCMSYQLHGSVSGDLMNYTQAHRSYQSAYRIAQELDDLELLAATLVRQGIVFMRQDKPLKAISYFQAANEAIIGHGFKHLRGNIFQVLSEAQAKAQQPQECWRSIGFAEDMLQQKSTAQEHSLRLFSTASVTAHKGTDALLLKDYDRALRLIEKSLITYNPTLTPGRARLLARKAEVYLGLGEIDACTTTAIEALNLATSVGASNTKARIQNLYTSLTQATSKWKREAGVAHLGIALRK